MKQKDFCQISGQHLKKVQYPISFLLRLGVWCLMPLSPIFHYIVAVHFIGGGNHRPVASH